MSLHLPPSGDPLRELRDLAAFAAPGAPRNAFLATLVDSRAFLARNPEALSLHAFAFRANGDLWLIEVTRGGWRKKWHFGR